MAIYQERQKRQLVTAPPKRRVLCSKDSFVANQTLVIQIKYCGKSPALWVAAKRYAQGDKKIVFQMKNEKKTKLK